MLMLYNSDAYAVVRFDQEAQPTMLSAQASTPATVDATADWSTAAAAAVPRGFEIIDKRSRKEIFVSGALAASFQHGAEKLSESNPTPEQWDDYIAGFTSMAQQPLVMH